MAALAPFPINLDFSTEISTKELLGKGKPKLYGRDYALRKKANEAFKDMQIDASREGINLYIVSGYRSFKTQQHIWNKKYKSYRKRGLTPQQCIEQITRYSTIPGTSRHHWGTEIDLIDTAVDLPKNVLHPKHYTQNGVFCPLKEWMDKNAANYGYNLVYTNNQERTGFNYEPWHYSYKELSINYLKKFLEIDLANQLQHENIKGSSNLTSTFLNKYRQDYLLGIHPRLIP